jgi:hypothetical protein
MAKPARGGQGNTSGVRRSPIAQTQPAQNAIQQATTRSVNVPFTAPNGGVFTATPSGAILDSNGNVVHTGVFADHSDTQMMMLRTMMGQTGDEAGQNRRFQGDPRSIYVQTSKSYLVNQALESDMKSLTNPFIQQNNGAMHWIRTGYTMNDATQAIRSIDAGMKPTTQDLRLVRYESDRAFSTLLGKQLTASEIRSIQGMSDSQLQTMFVGRDRTSKGYLSTSWRMDTNSARDRQYMSSPVSFEYTTRAGVHAIVTNNLGEHEALIGRGYRQTVTGVRREGKQIVFSVTLDPNNRSGYYKV